MPMDDRKQRVLRAIVALYETDGEPVGSGLLAEHFDIPVSSATLRNEMATLTKLGFLEQPHTSAGRVPSAKGYRYYLDNLLEAASPLPKTEQHYLSDVFDTLDYDPERLVQGAAKALSDMCGLAVIATTPFSQDTFIVHYEVIQVGRYKAAVLGVTNTGSVRTRVAKVGFELAGADCKTLEDVLNSALTFRAPQDVSAEYIRGVAGALGHAGRLTIPVLNAASVLLNEAGRESVFLEGQKRLFETRETADSLAAILELAQVKERLEQIYPKTERTTVILGEDIEQTPIPGVCVISRKYIAGGGLSGMIAVIGSNRLPFMRIIPRLEYFALSLGQSISGG